MCIFEWDGCVQVSKVHLILIVCNNLCIVRCTLMRIGHGVPLYWVKPDVHSPLPIYGIDRLCGIYWYSSTSNTSNFHPWIQVTSHQWLHERKQAQSLTRNGGQYLEPTLLIRSLIIKNPFAFVCVSCVCADTCLSCVCVSVCFQSACPVC